MRVVKTRTETGSVSSDRRSEIRNPKSIYAPSERPIQSRCLLTTAGAQPDSISFNPSISSSAYAVVRRNHCSRLFLVTGLPQRQQRPPLACSFERVAWSCSHQLTCVVFLYARPISCIFRKNH